MRNDPNKPNKPKASDNPSRPSLLSGLHRPTLAGTSRGAGGADIRADFEETLSIPARPRRLWKVSDTGVPSIPPFFPTPLDPRLSTYVPDASPSVVAVRVAEALRKLSVAAEYDDENYTATCMTADRCQFMIHLWQAKAPSDNSTAAASAAASALTTEESAFATKQPGGLLVEFRRVSGDTITFHYTVSALKKAAKSHGTGQDFRKPQQTGPMEFPRFIAAGSTEKPTIPSPDPSSPSTRAIEGLEHAAGLLRKDRLDAQLRGMEEVMNLTDSTTSGLDIAFTSCLAIMGAQFNTTNGDDASASSNNFVSAAQTLHQDWIYRLLVDRELPDEAIDAPPRVEENTEKASWLLCGFGGDHDVSNVNDRQIEQMREDRVRMGDDYHGGSLRSMALRCLANALSLLSRYNPKALYTTLSTHGGAMISEELFQALWEDATGASRPPGIVAGTRLASPHEAAIAIRCIRMLGQAHPKAKQRLIKHKKYALEQLEKCYFIGQANHEILENEAKRTYRFLTANS